MIAFELIWLGACVQHGLVKEVQVNDNHSSTQASSGSCGWLALLQLQMLTLRSLKDATSLIVRPSISNVEL